MKISAFPRMLTIISLFGTMSCTPSQNAENTTIDKRQYVEQQNPVKVVVLESGQFKKEIVNNGTLAAVRKSELRFRVNEQLETLAAKSGDRVREDQLIASLVPFKYKQELSGAEIRLQKAKLEMQDVLIGQGYNTLDTTKIPSYIFEMASVKSGYSEALQNIQTAEFNMKATRLTAPFSGLIANIEHKCFEQVNAGEVFCILIDDSEFEVEFRIVESEISSIEVGNEVQIIPFSNSHKTYKGQVSQINPLIDNNGLILVKALVKNTGELLEGMNVKVLVEKEIPNQLIVPKSAVVLRQNQEVLFRYTNGVAFWTYVQTVAENSSSYSVIAHPEKGGTLAAGDTIIVSGNLNLAHESEVIIQ